MNYSAAALAYIPVICFLMIFLIFLLCLNDKMRRDALKSRPTNTPTERSNTMQIILTVNVEDDMSPYLVGICLEQAGRAAAEKFKKASRTTSADAVLGSGEAVILDLPKMEDCLIQSMNMRRGPPAG